MTLHQPTSEPEWADGLVLNAFLESHSLDDYGFASIKYVALVAIVIAILVFLAVYLIPALTD